MTASDKGEKRADQRQASCLCKAGLPDMLDTGETLTFLTVNGLVYVQQPLGNSLSRFTCLKTAIFAFH